MQKVEISVAVDNQSSRGVCERLGFKLEGIITRAENLNGRVVDHAVYGLNRTILAKT
jgi:ribosomal-protein-serine acetyltransferase